MSEYQYYEFQALDRPLTPAEQKRLRSISSRATITSTSFTNEYDWGDLRGNPDDWMDRYFDAHLYYANWGTRVLCFRIPASFLTPSVARKYSGGDRGFVRTKQDKIILTFATDADDPGDLDEDYTHQGLLASLIGVRAALQRGDHRALYLWWLFGVQTGTVKESALEPDCVRWTIVNTWIGAS